MRGLVSLKWIIPVIRAIQLFSTNRVSPVWRQGMTIAAEEVGMTGTTGTMRIMLAGWMLGRIRTGRLVPDTGLAGINRIGQTTQIGACGSDYRRSGS